MHVGVVEDDMLTNFGSKALHEALEFFGRVEVGDGGTSQIEPEEVVTYGGDLLARG